MCCYNLGECLGFRLRVTWFVGMALLKKNIWSIYLLFLVGSFVLAIITASIRWTDIYQNQALQQIHRAEQVASAMKSVLASHEMLLDVLGLQLLPQYRNREEPHSPQLFDDLMAINPSISGFALTNPNGRMVLVDSTADRGLLPNLLEQESSRDSFLHTLASKRMVVGRTYYQDALGSWGIPIRKALRNEQGEVVAVMAAVIRAEGVAPIFDNELYYGNHDEVSLVRAQDHYLQYQSAADSDPAQLYHQPVDSERLQASLDQLVLSSQLVLDKIKQQSQAHAYVVDLPQGKRIEAAVYEAEHEFWVFSSVSLRDVLCSYGALILVYGISFILVHIMVFLLFRSVARSEKRSRDELQYQAYHDSLTLLPNRQFLIDHAHQRMASDQDEFSLLFLDVDNFKGINDNFGHDYGDRFLVKLGSRLKAVLSRDDVLVRLGGDEFVVITSKCCETELHLYCEQLLACINADDWIEGSKIHIGASIGIASYPQHGSNLNELLRAADIAMYKAKEDSNGVEFFRQDVEQQYLHDYRIEQLLRAAIGTDELYMNYQPQLDQHHTLIGVEALVRWTNPELGFIPPNEFIAIAENRGLMSQLGHFIIERTLSDMRALHQSCEVDFTVSINISVRQLLQRDFVSVLVHQVEHYQFQPQHIVLEITENVFIEDINNLGAIVIELRNRGFNISLDDFGTGYSSLSVLQKLPIDELKVDKSFVDNITTDEKARQMIRNIIAIGKNYGMSVLAEGVETENQVRMLGNFGCDYFQGYWFAKPMNVDDLQRFIRCK